MSSKKEKRLPASKGWNYGKVWRQLAGVLEYTQQYFKPTAVFQPELPDPRIFIGREVRIPMYKHEGKHKFKTHDIRVEIKKITGNIQNPQYYEINEQYTIGMLRFHAQMEGCENEYTEAEFRAFETMEFSVERVRT